jgi:tRNA(adenine34) deaminase
MTNEEKRLFIGHWSLVIGHSSSMTHDFYMQLALQQAEEALAENEVPVGCVILRGEQVIAAAHDQREQLRDPTAHAEMIAITQAAQSVNDWRLEGCTLYATLEPCCMCAGAILNARIPHVIYGATNPKAGAVQSLFHLLDDERLNHRCEVVPGILAGPCGEILTRFFQGQRRLGKK